MYVRKRAVKQNAGRKARVAQSQPLHEGKTSNYCCYSQGSIPILFGQRHVRRCVFEHYLQATNSDRNENSLRAPLRRAPKKHVASTISLPCFIQAKRHFPVVEENEVLALVRNERLEVRSDNAVPCGPVLHFELRLRQ